MTLGPENTFNTFNQLTVLAEKKLCFLLKYYFKKVSLSFRCSSAFLFGF